MRQQTERVAKALWNVAAEETGTRRWEECEDDHRMKEKYRLVAQITIAVLSIVLVRHNSH